MKKPSFQIYQIKVTLDNITPPIWRRFLVSGDTTLLRLHDILQSLMGWQNYHLYQYKINGKVYGDPANDEMGTIGTLNEADFKLSQVIHRKEQEFQYEYDFGCHLSIGRF